MYYRLCDADREQYGGPEWVMLDTDTLLDVRASQLADWEREMGLSLIAVLGSNAVESADGLRAQLWLARKQAGIVEAWENFDPRVLATHARVEPPASDLGKDQPQPEPSLPDFSESAP